jgi:hypothetical protein
MNIQRAARPDRGFLILDNAVARDERLSYRARGILAAILSRPDDWRSDYKTLAREGKEGESAVRTALRELRDAGYVEHVKSQDERGRWSTTTYVYDRPQSASPQVAPSVGKPKLGGPESGGPAPIPSTETYDRDEDGVDWVPASAVTAELPSPIVTQVTRETATIGPDHGHRGSGFEDWRAQDRQAFRDAVNSPALTSDGAYWREGTWPVDTWYDALRDRKQNKIRWPGRYLAGLDEGLGLDAWLEDAGLERTSGAAGRIAS